MERASITANYMLAIRLETREKELGVRGKERGKERDRERKVGKRGVVELPSSMVARYYGRLKTDAEKIIARRKLYKLVRNFLSPRFYAGVV